ncbi:MAG: GNAT family N-acetyltransferase [Acidobacteria bacterium]|nr:GNAT family N-acetyltransferase [Acidobacteriota bacterium]
MEPSLARDLDALQARRNEAWRTLALRLERAQAAQNLACCRATPGGLVLEAGEGFAFFLGPGHPLSQALAMGLAGPLDQADLDRIEAHLSREGGRPQYELCPLADPGLFQALGQRGYRIQEFQLAWSRVLAPSEEWEAPPPGLEIGPGRDPEAFLRVVMAGFLECGPEAVPAEVLEAFMPSAKAPGTQLWCASRDGELLGGGTLFLHEGTAVLSGAGVPPRHRRKGVQGALIRARLAAARAAGCDLAVSGTAPGSPSQRNMERHGFRVAYPKVVLLAPERAS